MKEAVEEHEVVRDMAGFNPRTRLTCLTCDGATIIWQLWISPGTWREIKEEFLEQHPCSKIKDLG